MGIADPDTHCVRNGSQTYHLTADEWSLWEHARQLWPFDISWFGGTAILEPHSRHLSRRQKIIQNQEASQHRHDGWQRLQQRGLIVVWPASAQLLRQWAHHIIVQWTGPVDLPDFLSWGPRMNGRTLVAMMTEMHAIWERTPESVWDLPWPLPLHRVRRVGWLQWEDRTLD